MELHQLLAIENDVSRVAQNLLTEAAETFTKRIHLFDGKTRSLEMFSDERKGEEAAGTEIVLVQETVPEKLNYVFNNLGAFYDLILKKESTNQDAKADLSVDGKTLGADLPVTFLLGMESRLQHIRSLVAATPTRELSCAWEGAPELGPNIFKTKDTSFRHKTEQKKVVVKLAPATVQHKEQVALEDQTVVVGNYAEQRFSGRWTPAEKAEVLARIDKVLYAVKQARQAANTQTVTEQQTIGQNLFNYIMNG